MRHIDKIIVHCSDTPPHMDIGVKEINEWHLAKGWSGIGYHYVIRRDGKVHAGRDLAKVGAHVQGHNGTSIGICLVGGADGKFDFAKEQIDSLELLILELLDEFPQASICGHNDFTQAKTCPNFNVKEWWG